MRDDMAYHLAQYLIGRPLPQAFSDLAEVLVKLERLADAQLIYEYMFLLPHMTVELRLSAVQKLLEVHRLQESGGRG